MPFDLHPEYPPEGISRSQLVARYGEEFHERLKRQFEAQGLVYNPPPDVVPNTRRALRLNELARDRDLHEPMHDRLMKAYWEEGRNIGDPDELRLLAAEVGLAAEDVDRVLDSDEYGDRLERSTREAYTMGITGVPGFLLDRRLLVLGAQPRELFEQAFEQLEDLTGA
jgi:predicted DsbA family dithiol-disulfide isomerase